MKRFYYCLAVLILVTLLFALIITNSALAYDKFGAETGAGAPTEPSMDPVVPTASPDPVPSMDPNPDYSFTGPDPDGYWHSGYSFYNELSPSEIMTLLDENDSDMVAPYFDEMPNCFSAPWILGRATDENLMIALNRCNMLRRLAGLDPVELDEQCNISAQYAVWLMNHNNTLSHHQSCDQNIPEQFCTEGCYGCLHSNLYKGSGSMALQCDAYMNEMQPDNLADAGHRQHMLNPRLATVGFGWAGSYKSMRIGERTDEAASHYDFISWPNSGACPLNTPMFNRYSPWSIAFPMGSIRMPSVSDELTIEITHNGETVSELVLGRSPMMPADASQYISSGEYIRIASPYTNQIVLVFRPDLSGIELEGEFVVEIRNLKYNRSLAPITIRYRTVFFDIDNIGLEEPIQAPDVSTLIGDVNANGVLDMGDALLIMRFGLALIDFTSDELGIADYNMNGSVDMSDALLVMRYSMNLIQTTD